MHNTPLPGSSPKHSKNHTIQSLSKQQPIYGFSMKQVAQFQQENDDVKYQQKIVSRFIVIGRIKELVRAMSQRNAPILKIRLDDGTKDWKQTKPFIVYDPKMEEKFIYAMKHNLYVQMACQPKITGLVYKAEIQINAYSFGLVEDFNEVTAHLLSCMKASLVTL